MESCRHIGYRSLRLQARRLCSNVTLKSFIITESLVFVYDLEEIVFRGRIEVKCLADVLALDEALRQLTRRSSP